MNPSGFGGFAEGLSGGVNNAMNFYMQATLSKIESDKKRAVARGEMVFKLFSDESLPLKVRKQAYNEWRQLNKDWKTGIQAPDISDEEWKEKKLTPYFKRGLAILKNKDYSDQDKMNFIREIEVEAMDEIGGKATNVTDVFKPIYKDIEQEKERVKQRELGGLFLPETTTIPGIEGQQVPSQLGKGFTIPSIAETKYMRPSATAEAMGLSPEKARSAAALVSAGVKPTELKGMFAQEAEIPTEWNTYYASQKAKGLSDKQIVEEYKKLGRKPKEGWQRKTRTYIKNGKQYKQDYDYNPRTRESMSVGKPYESRDIGSALEKWLLGESGNDPAGVF